jgi:epoxyqueuosine reductase
VTRVERGDPQIAGLPKGVRTHLPVLGDARAQRGTAASTANGIEHAIREDALGLGFVGVGFAAITPFALAKPRLQAWLASGNHGDMTYLAGDDRTDPSLLLKEAQSMVVVALPHPTRSDTDVISSGERLNGIVARYARGMDYHQVLKQKLTRLADATATRLGRPVLARACVDTAPLLEREAARLAGVGFIGKNTLAILPGIGSYVLLGELLLDVTTDSTRAIAGGCGTCRACLDACPTGAFVDEFTLDARRCISYLTIEFQGIIPRQYRRAMGTMVYGCDVCQEACPYNASTKPKPAAPELRWRKDLVDLDLIELLKLTSSGYRRLIKRSTLRRASRETLQRNAAIALGNSGDPRAVAPLIEALLGNRSAVVRAHAGWALGQLASAEAQAALEQALADPEAVVREEATAALAEAFPSP